MTITNTRKSNKAAGCSPLVAASVASGFFFSENFFKRLDEFMVFSVSAHLPCADPFRRQFKSPCKDQRNRETNYKEQYY